MKGTSGFQKLLEPARIGQMRVKNRIVMPAMGTNLASQDGYVTEHIKDYYEQRAKGGVGLVIVEVTCVDSPVGKTMANQLVVDDNKFIPGLSELAEVIHRHGAKAVLELHHAGRGARSKITHIQPVAPSPIPMPLGTAVGYEGELPRELTMGEIEALVDKFARAAGRARKAGFDGVEIHGTGFYLVAQFLSSASNKRRDDYGGELKNRAKFLLEIVRAIKEAEGQTYPVLCKLSAREFGKEAGITLEEGRQIARMGEAAGLDAIEVGGMAWGVSPHIRPPTSERPGSFLPFVEAIKNVLTVPVIAGSRFTPELGEKALEEGKLDFVAVGRGLIADPELPNKIASGMIEEVRPCIGCVRCIDNVSLKGGHLLCTVNPAAGSERENELRAATRRKRVLVVGAGPAGMETARVAASRGHNITLYERQSELGGQLSRAVVPPHKDNLRSLIEYFTTQMMRRGISVKLGVQVTSGLIEEAKPDVVVLATGATPIIPEIPGIDRPSVLTAERVLDGQQVGQRIAIIGGGLVGCETAEFLAEQGKEITILEMLDEMAVEVIPALRALLLSRLVDKGVTMLAGVKCQELKDGSLIIVMKEGDKRTIQADTIILAAGTKPNTDLFQALQGKALEVYSVGDCVHPQNVAEAMADGYRVGRGI
jgi:2,4-dienoyl-CoA reductase-like NADH-dependent reductase (Old Yellow Enzyme family)/thioredoxin reductase